MISKLALLALLLVSVYAGNNGPKAENSQKKDVWTSKIILQTSHSDDNNFVVLRAYNTCLSKDFSINSRHTFIKIASGPVSEKDKPFRDNLCSVFKINGLDDWADIIIEREQKGKMPDISFEISTNQGRSERILKAKLAIKVAHDFKRMSKLFKLVSDLQNDSKEKKRFAIEFAMYAYSKVQTETEENGDAVDEGNVKLKIDLMFKVIGFTYMDDIGGDFKSLISSIGSPKYLPQVEYLYEALYVGEQDDDHDQE